jgi:uncharacterized membrane protein affecting hemolysin expression
VRADREKETTLDDPLLIIALLACAAVLVILLMGINSFRKGGEYAARNSNKFMRWRLIAQFIAVVLILAFVYVRGQSGG